MSWFRRIVQELAVETEQSFVRRAQLRSLSKQLPLLYVTLCTNALALAFTHLETAPHILTFAVPAILVPACAARVIAWRRMSVDRLSDTDVVRQLRRTMLLVLVLGISFTGWSLSLLPYGDAYGKAHVAFFMSITVVGCIFCLVHLRAAALLLTIVVIIPFTIRLVSTGQLVLTAMAINVLIVAVAMTFKLLAYYEDFRSLVRGQAALARLSDENRRVAESDGLTGLANRRRFFDDVAAAIECHGRADGSFALGLIDLDGFKPVNDLHGHKTGDEVLVAVGRRLRETAGPDVLVARLGGDEFAWIMPLTDGPGAQALGQALCEVVARPIETGDRVVRVAASTGIAVFPAMARTVDQLMERADFALYHAKETSRGTAVMFTEEHAGQIRERRQLEHQLRAADVEREFRVVFQPIVDSLRGVVVAFEALARWNSPVLGPVPPAAFIEAAERIGAVRHLTPTLFRKAAEAAQLWPASITLSFNLSADDLMDEAAASRLTTMVTQSGLSPARIVFEVTETAVMRDFQQASSTLSTLRALGCRIALDDFGTGYSSLRYVHKLPLDKLKIDRSFVQSLDQQGECRAIVSSILDLSRNLGIACVAEGVETPEQRQQLQALGCSLMQGYLFGRPGEAVDVLASLGGDNRPPAASTPTLAA